VEASNVVERTTTIGCPRCGVALPLDQGVGPAARRRWTCTRCGLRFDAERRELEPGIAVDNGRDVTNQVIFGARVRARRRALRMPSHALASAAGISVTFLKQIERGARNPSLDTLVRLSAALGLDPAQLVIGLGPGQATGRR
jgi:DNA-binding XRE family transcriptional regulator/ribosomal protein S27AE